MSWEFLYQALGTALAVGLTAGLTAVLNQAAASTQAAVNANRFELRMNKLYAWMGWGCCLIAVVFTLGTLWDPDPALYVLTLMMWLLFGGIGFAMLLNYYYHRVSWDEDQLVIVSWRKQEVRLAWGEIDQIKYDKSFSQLKLRSGEKWYGVSTNLVGLKALVLKLEVKTGGMTDDSGLPF